jgi:lipoate synthase
MDREEAQKLQDKISKMMDQVIIVNSIIARSDLPDERIDDFFDTVQRIGDAAEAISLILENY